jgi:hypothetical protein
VGYVSQKWDDLIDGDAVSASEINRMMWLAIVEIPNNPFYKQHADNIQHMLASIIQDWFTANDLEQGGEHDKNIAFVLRDKLVSFVCYIALLTGGYDWAAKVNPEITRYFFTEDLEAYKAGLK